MLHECSQIHLIHACWSSTRNSRKELDRCSPKENENVRELDRDYQGSTRSTAKSQGTKEILNTQSHRIGTHCDTLKATVKQWLHWHNWGVPLQAGRWPNTVPSKNVQVKEAVFLWVAHGRVITASKLDWDLRKILYYNKVKRGVSQCFYISFVHWIFVRARPQSEHEPGQRCLRSGHLHATLMVSACHWIQKRNTAIVTSVVSLQDREWHCCLWACSQCRVQQRA